MTTTTKALAAFTTQVTTAVASLGLSIQIGQDWPSVQGLSNVTAGTVSLITVYDRKLTTNVTRWLPNTVGVTQLPCGIVATASATTLSTGHPSTITLSFPEGSSSVNVDDAVMFNAQNNGIFDGATAKAVGGDTLATMATKLAAAINASSQMGQWITATASGDVVTVTSRLSKPTLYIAALTSNNAQIEMDVNRKRRHMQVVIWASDPTTRDTIKDCIEAFIAAQETNYGFSLSNGEMVQVVAEGDMAVATDEKTGIYRYDFLVALEFSISQFTTAYPILSTIPTRT